MTPEQRRDLVELRDRVGRLAAAVPDGDHDTLDVKVASLIDCLYDALEIITQPPLDEGSKA